ncbi:Uncharacterised protein [uncultured Comamonas sp.]|nr:Uncharacterised protein [uncultured Comamonas sp.]
MTIPLIIGLATTAHLAKKGYDNYQKNSEADEIIKEANTRYESKKNFCNEKEKEARTALELLEKKVLKISESFSKIKILTNTLIDQDNIEQINKTNINILKYKLQKINNYSHSSINLSTTNFIFPSLNIESLVGDSFGISGLLRTVVTSPAFTIASRTYNSHGDEALENSYKDREEINSAIRELIKNAQKFEETANYANKIINELTNSFDKFQQYFEKLKNINDFIEQSEKININTDASLKNLNNQSLSIIQNGYLIATILADVIAIPFFMLQKSNNAVLCNEDGVPEMAKDADGSLIINKAEIDASLDKAKFDASLIMDII